MNTQSKAKKIAIDASISYLCKINFLMGLLLGLGLGLTSLTRSIAVLVLLVVAGMAMWYVSVTKKNEVNNLVNQQEEKTDD